MREQLTGPSASTRRIARIFTLPSARRWRIRSASPSRSTTMSKATSCGRLESAGIRLGTRPSVQRSKTLFTRSFSPRVKVSVRRRADPIFIVGLPRAGSTLLEQILASHSSVEGTMELPDIMAMATQLGDKRADQESRYPGVLAELSAEACLALGEQYLTQTRIQRKTDRPFFIDKMPNNFLHIGLIRLILPHAKIIDARRHPMACCFSAFKQNFAQGQRYTYSLEDLARYYRDYVDLMAHFDRGRPRRDPPGHLRGAGRRYRRRNTASAGLLRPAIRAGHFELLRKRPRGPDCELATGTPADIPRGFGSMATLRALARAAAAHAGRCARVVSDVRALPDTPTSRMHATREHVYSQSDYFKRAATVAYTQGESV